MRYTTEDLPRLAEEVRRTILENGLELSDFDITTVEHPHKVCVESHGKMGGFIYNLFSTWDFDSLTNRIKEWGKNYD